jgi:hypothetical protein
MDIGRADVRLRSDDRGALLEQDVTCSSVANLAVVVSVAAGALALTWARRTAA